MLLKRNRIPYNHADQQRLLPIQQSPWEQLQDGAVSRQVIDMAARRGRIDAAGNPDLTGLVLEQGDLTYLVGQRAVIDKEKQHVHKISERNWKPRKEGSATIFYEIGRRKDVFVEGTDRLSTIDLDVLDSDNNLVAKTTFETLDEFLAFLNSHGPEDVRKPFEKNAKGLGHSKPQYLFGEEHNTALPRGPLTRAEWGTEKSPPPAELSLADKQRKDITLAYKGDVLDQIFAQREQLGLPGNSLVGLTLKKGARTLQVTEDVLVHNNEAYGTDFKRTWVITEYDEHGQPVKQKQRIYRDDQLRTILNKKDTSDPHWEIPKDKLRDAARVARVGREALQTAQVYDGTDAGRRITLDDAFELLSYPDIYGGDKVKQRVAKLKRKSGLMVPGGPINSEHEDAIVDSPERKIAETLRRTIMRFGTAKVSKLAENLRDTYIHDAKVLGIPISKEKNSPSWVFRDIAEQRYYALHPEEAEDIRKTDDYGVKVGDPMGEGLTAQRKQREIIDYQIGLAFMDAMRPSFSGQTTSHVDREGVIEPKLEAYVTLKPSDKELKNLQDFVRKDIDKLLGNMMPVIEKELQEVVDPKAIGEPDKPDRLPQRASDVLNLMEIVNRAQAVKLGRLLRRQLMS